MRKKTMAGNNDTYMEYRIIPIIWHLIRMKIVGKSRRRLKF